MVTVKNKGNVTETFSVSAYYGSFLIQTLSVESLLPTQNRVVTFVWNTTLVPTGSYTIKAVADTLPGETETSDNTFVDGAVIVRAPRILIFPRELSIIVLVVAAAISLFAIVLLLTRRKKKTPSSVTLSVDVLPD
jgi:ABC-type maltose transport system permease subunit